LVNETASTSEQERIVRIIEGYPADHLVTVRSALTLTATLAEQLFAVSQSTLLRRLKDRQRLSSVTSERLDRLASVAHLAQEVFENRDRALSWLSSPNIALGSQPPIMLCETELGANQVRRVLHALEWGGAA
jgi:putative toxin-antitoxin system antitoxin component (TIGR02293 family)